MTTRSFAEQEAIEQAVRSQRFAMPGEVERGAKIVFDASVDGRGERWVVGTVYGPNKENSACLDVMDDQHRVWVTHWGRTRLMEQKFVGARLRIRNALRSASSNQEYVRVRQEDLRELEELVGELLLKQST